MIRLEHIPDPNNHFDNARIIVETDEICLPELLEDITSFLKACGFQLQGLEATYGEED